MFIVAYCPPKSRGQREGAHRFKLVGVADSVEVVMIILRRHNPKGSVTDRLRRTLQSEGMCVTGGRYVTIDLRSDRIRKIADGVSARSSIQVAHSGIDDDTVRDIFFNGMAIYRNQKINDIFR